MKKIGFVLNPIAGMGGRVGLKGTDGMVKEAIKRGAKPFAAERAKEAMEGLSAKIFTCSPPMGEECLGDCEVIYSPPKKTSALDTKKACKAFLNKKVDIVVFCGGDGTARDVYSIIGKKLPILGIPAGVKMHSSVFAVNAIAAREVLTQFLEGKTQLIETEIMDVDESAFRDNRLKTKIYGYAITPYKKMLIQQGKMVFSSMDEERYKKEIALFLSLICKKGITILGAGTTVEKIAEELGIKKSLLGVDVIKDGKIVARDASEDEILHHLNGEKARIIVSPTGRQGFIFGRGNQQISARVIKKVGTNNIIIASTPHKLAQTPYLFVDTGDKEIDKKLVGWRSVITGFGIAERKEVRCGYLLSNIYK
ncbi:ATP-NAD kinase [Thermoplasmatales archaeon ex4484_30]|nr:MAG: ATP-NAD kinase [Thermoplasmatales archaeon ex4484_30]